MKIIAAQSLKGEEVFLALSQENSSLR